MRLLRYMILVSVGFALIGAAPVGAAVNPGDVLVVDNFSASVVIVDPGGIQTVLSTGGLLIAPFDIMVDNGGRIFVADVAAGAIIEIDPNNGNQNIVSAGGLLNIPVGLTLDGSGETILVTNTGNKSLVTVQKNSGLQGLIHSGGPFVAPFNVAINKFGTIYVVDQNANGGSVFEMVAGVPVLLSSGGLFVTPWDIATDQGISIFPANEPGGIYIADRNAQQGAVIYVDPNNGAQSVFADGNNAPYSDPSGFTISQPTPVRMYTADQGNNSIIQNHILTGDGVVLTSGGNLVNALRCTVIPEQPVPTEDRSWGSIKGDYR